LGDDKKWVATIDFNNKKVSPAVETTVVALRACGGATRGKSDAIQTRHGMETAAKCAVLAKEADDPEEREYFARMRDAWIRLANRCEFIDFPDVTEKEPL